MGTKKKVCSFIYVIRILDARRKTLGFVRKQSRDVYRLCGIYNDNNTHGPCTLDLLLLEIEFELSSGPIVTLFSYIYIYLPTASAL